MKMLTGYIALSEGEARIAGCNMMENRIEGAGTLDTSPKTALFIPR